MHKTGRWSKDIPTQLAARYQEARCDPALIEFSDDVAALESIAADALKRFNSGESGAAWRMLRDAFDKLESAMRAGPDKAHEVGEYLMKIRGIIHDGAAATAARDEFVDLLERKSVIATREHKRQIDLKVMLTMDQANAFFLAMAGAVNQHVKDAVVLKRIRAAWDGILGVRARAIEGSSAGESSGGSPAGGSETIIDVEAEP